VAAEHDDFVGGDEGAGLCLHGEGELQRELRPDVVGDIVLLNGVDPAAPFIASEHINEAILKDYGRHRASLLVQLRYFFPPVQVDGVALAGVQDPVNGTPPDGIHVVALVRQRMRVSALGQSGFFGAGLIFSVVHEDAARDVGEGGVEAARDKDAPIIESNGHRIGLEDEVLGDFLLAPGFLVEVKL